MKRLADHHRIFLALLGLLVLGSALGQRYPWHIDEVRFTGIALEMLQNNQWYVPHRASEIYADKPPIFFWLLASLIQLTGSVRWSFLLPGVMSGIATMLLIYDLGARWWNRNTGLCAAILLLSSYQFWRITTSAHIDSILVFFTTLGIYGFARHLKSGNDTSWFYAGFAAVAAGILAKGVGFLPLLIFIPYAVAHWRDRDMARIPLRQWMTGIGIVLGLLLCWLVPLLLRADSNVEIKHYLDNILLRQTAQRYANAWQHREPFWFFFANIPKYWAPLSFTLPLLVMPWWRRIKRHDTRYTLLLGWAALVILFFSMSTGKRELYMLPALPAVALAAAPAVLMLIRHRWVQRTATAITTLLIAVVTIAAVVRIANLLPKSRLAIWPDSAGWALLVIAAIIVALTISLRRRVNPVFIAIAGYGLLVIFYHQVLVPMLDEKMAGHIAMQQLSEHAAPADLALIEWDEREWLYALRPVLHNGKGSDPAENLCSTAQSEIRWVLTAERASTLGITTEPAFALQRKQNVVAANPIDISNCKRRDEFRYRFEWSADSLKMLGR